jgi:excisionase family DNA binding protein
VTSSQTAPSPTAILSDERSALVDLDAILAGGAEEIRLVDEVGNRAVLPQRVRQLLRQIVRALVEERPVSVVALPHELSVRRAADILDIPVTRLVEMLDQGEIPYTMRGANRRIRVGDLAAFSAQRSAERRAALAELTRLSQEMGLYDLEMRTPSPQR